MTLTQSYEEKRDLLIGQLYKRSNTSVASRSYTYDTLRRPVTRSTSKDGSTVNDSFGYNSRSELNTATVNNEEYAYDYDNIGNRVTAQEAAESATSIESNRLNQYTAIGDFEPTYDDAGNQTTVKTTTGIWSVIYNAENRPVSFTNTETNTVIECAYDYMGRRATKKVSVNGSVTLNQRFLYRGYLQIACCDLTRSNHPCLWLITWDPSQPVATRPLAIQKDGTWYTYGWDLTKNICEVYGQHGYIRTNYSFTPYGEVSISGDVTQPIQWSSEYVDTETTLAYYNYRYYSTTMGRWLSRDKISELKEYPYIFVRNSPTTWVDYIGHKKSRMWSVQPHEHDITLDGDYVIYNYMEMEYNNLNEQIHLLANLSIESRNRKVILRARSIANSVGTYLLTDDLDYSDQEMALAEVEYTIYCDPSGMLASRKKGDNTSIDGSAMASVSVDFSEGERTGKVNIGFESKIEGAELTWKTSIGVKSSSLSVSYPVKTHNVLKNNVEFRLMCKCED